jgi:hypothetical protein
LRGFAFAAPRYRTSFPRPHSFFSPASCCIASLCPTCRDGCQPNLRRLISPERVPHCWLSLPCSFRPDSSSRRRHHRAATLSPTSFPGVASSRRRPVFPLSTPPSLL